MNKAERGKWKNAGSPLGIGPMATDFDVLILYLNLLFVKPM